MPDDRLPQRTLKTTVLVAGLFTVVYLAYGQMAAACGIAIGSMLGLVSLWSLTIAVPRLFRSPNQMSKLWLGLLMLAKLPLYAGVLMFAMSSPAVNAFTVFVGVALVPVVLVLKVVGHMAVTATGISEMQEAKG
jgi:hypothetical protein